jgi:hypothetical protein
MKKQTTTWGNLSEDELVSIHGGGWFDDFKKGFKQGFDWAAGLFKDLIALFK